MYNRERGIEESNGEMYEDLESILVQERVEDVSMAGPSGAEAPRTFLPLYYYFLVILDSIVQCWGPSGRMIYFDFLA